MKRAEAVQSIVWCLLRYADNPADAVATGESLVEYLGDGHERQMTFTNLLRAAGLFAKDDDGYFLRYRRANGVVDDSLLNLPEPNHVLAFPVPAEPRMRIAYNVFAGLLLKYLHQTYETVPIEVTEGIARVVVSTPLPSNDALWGEFKRSSLMERAVREGLAATLGAIGGIGGIDVTETIANSALLPAFLTVLPQFSDKFQSQGGMRLDFYLSDDVDKWLGQQHVDGTDISIIDLWRTGWQEGSSPNEVAKQIAARVVRGVNRDQPLPVRTFRSLWTGEGSGANRKRGMRDNLPKAVDEDARRAKLVDDGVVRLLSQLDARRQDTEDLHQWVRSKLNAPEQQRWLDETVAAIQAVVTSTITAKPLARDATWLIDSIIKEFETQTIVPSLRKDATGHSREMRSAIQQTIGLCIATLLATQLTNVTLVSILDWRVETLRQVKLNQAWALRFLKKRRPGGGTRIAEIKPFGNVERLIEDKAKSDQTPLRCVDLDSDLSVSVSEPFPSEQRCIVCGSSSDLLAGAKSFLPEAKKRHYETPTREESPCLCSNCALIAYLSSVYPSSDLSIVEFPADNFLELFALYESLQGVSAMVALKYVNRVASLSVLPNRYLLLSHQDRRGRMDGKTQVYLQLREQTHLLKYIDRPMRVQIEGGIPQMWSEIHPHIAIGLGHFKELPPHYETTDSARKGFAYEIVRALQAGQSYKALYVAAKYAEDQGHPFERRVFRKDLQAYEAFISDHCSSLAKSLGGDTVCSTIYQDVREFSDYLFDLLFPLVKHEVGGSGSSVSGIARKYTDLILREFSEGMAGKFLYTVCQEADSAERDGDGWVKHNAFAKLYGGSPDTKGKSPAEAAQAWDEFRNSHAVQLEVQLKDYHCKYGNQYAVWHKFLRETQARTLAVLMLNVRQSK